MLPVASSSPSATSPTSVHDDFPVLHPVRMRMLRNIDRGELDHDLPVLVHLARQTFRLERLQAEAIRLGLKSGESIPRLRANLELAQVEGLDLQLQLITPLSQPALPLKHCDMAALEREIKQAENTGFAEWLAQWPQWQGVLARVPDAAERAATLVVPAWPEQP